MNHDALNMIAADQESLQRNLIDALCKLQHSVVDKELLGDTSQQDERARSESFFGFSIGVCHFVVQASCFCEVFVDIPVAALPNSPMCLYGLCNVRGILMPVYQLHQTFNVDLPSKPIILSVGKGEHAIGLLVDNLPLSLSLGSKQQQALSVLDNQLLQLLVQRAFWANDMQWYALNGFTLGSQLMTVATRVHQYQVINNIDTFPV